MGSPSIILDKRHLASTAITSSGAIYTGNSVTLTYLDSPVTQNVTVVIEVARRSTYPATIEPISSFTTTYILLARTISGTLTTIQASLTTTGRDASTLFPTAMSWSDYSEVYYLDSATPSIAPTTTVPTASDSEWDNWNPPASYMATESYVAPETHSTFSSANVIPRLSTASPTAGSCISIPLCRRQCHQLHITMSTPK